jgi:hypothetical protein
LSWAGKTDPQTMKTLHLAIASGLNCSLSSFAEYSTNKLFLGPKRSGTLDTAGNHKNCQRSEIAAGWIPGGRNWDDIKKRARCMLFRLYLPQPTLRTALLQLWLARVPAGSIWVRIFTGPPAEWR